MEKIMNIEQAYDKKKMLKKHVGTIHCSNNLSLIQRKLFNALLFVAYQDLPYKHKFQVKIKDLCYLIGFHSNDTKKLKLALIGLITLTIEWNIIDNQSGKESEWKASTALASAELSSGLCIYEYSQLMKELLYQPEMYGRIDINLLCHFKSSYGLALYENCIRYSELPQTPWFTIINFRKIMGIEDDKYPSFNDFKKRVLNIALSEVNSISPFVVELEVIRQNQKVTKIRFKINKFQKAVNTNETVTSQQQEIITILTSVFGLSRKSSENLFSIYDLNYIADKIHLISTSSSFKSGKIKGLAGYLVQALKSDYQKSPSSKEIIAKTLCVEKKQKFTEQDLIEKQYNQYISEVLESYFSQTASEETTTIMQSFKKSIDLQNKIFIRIYEQYGINHPATKNLFIDFIKKNVDAMSSVMNLEEFSTSLSENSALVNS